MKHENRHKNSMEVMENKVENICTKGRIKWQRWKVREKKKKGKVEYQSRRSKRPKRKKKSWNFRQRYQRKRGGNHNSRNSPE